MDLLDDIGDGFATVGGGIHSGLSGITRVVRNAPRMVYNGTGDLVDGAGDLFGEASDGIGNLWSTASGMQSIRDKENALKEAAEQGKIQAQKTLDQQKALNNGDINGHNTAVQRMDLGTGRGDWNSNPTKYQSTLGSDFAKGELDANPTKYQPTVFNFNADEDPGAKYRRDEALRAINARGAANGQGMNSGGRLADLMSKASGMASQEYQNAFDRNYKNNDLGFRAHSDYQNQKQTDLNSRFDRAYKTNDLGLRAHSDYQTQKQNDLNSRFDQLSKLAGNTEGGVARQGAAISQYGEDMQTAIGNRGNATANRATELYNTNKNIFGDVFGGGAKIVGDIISGLF